MSPTLQTLLIGFGALIALVLAGHVWGGAPRRRQAISLFFVLWFAYCVWHLTVGMSHGYSLTSEAPFFILNFGLPAIAGWIVLKKWR